MLIERCLCGSLSWTQIQMKGPRGLVIASCLNCGTKWLITHKTREDIEAWYAGGGYHDDTKRHANVIPYEDRYDSDRVAALKRIHRYRDRLPPHLVPNDSAILTYLLDVGAANGAFVHVALENGYNAIGIDPDARFQSASVKHGTLQTTPLPRGYEVITYHDVLEHLPDPLTEIRAAGNLLAPDGCIVLEVPDVHIEAGEKHYKPEHLWYFTLRTLAELVHDAGLEATKFDYPIPGKMAVFACRPR